MRGEELLPQIRRQRDPAGIDFGRAAWLVAAGLFKKVVISSYVDSAIVTPVFSAPHQHSALEILFAAYGFAVQIYADFSGYTDIAIGLAMFLGFRFPENFDAPYTARNLQDFWRRWHMTLSRWLRDYLYIPLGGSHGSRRTVARNIMITMVLGGLWHGAAWTFVAWGAIHGSGQVVGHLRRARNAVAAGLDPVPDGGLRVAVQRVVTFHIVCLGWIFFRADSFSTATTLIGRLFTAWGRAPLVTPAGRDHDRGHGGAAVPAPRDSSAAPSVSSPVNLGPCKGPYWGSCFSGSRRSGHRASHRSSITGSDRSRGPAFGFEIRGRFRACSCTRDHMTDTTADTPRHRATGPATPPRRHR